MSCRFSSADVIAGQRHTQVAYLVSFSRSSVTDRSQDREPVSNWTKTGAAREKPFKRVRSRIGAFFVATLHPGENPAPLTEVEVPVRPGARDEALLRIEDVLLGEGEVHPESFSDGVPHRPALRRVDVHGDGPLGDRH